MTQRRHLPPISALTAFLAILTVMFAAPHTARAASEQDVNDSSSTLSFLRDLGGSDELGGDIRAALAVAAWGRASGKKPKRVSHASAFFEGLEDARKALAYGQERNTQVPRNAAADWLKDRFEIGRMGEILKMATEKGLSDKALRAFSKTLVLGVYKRVLVAHRSSERQEAPATPQRQDHLAADFDLPEIDALRALATEAAHQDPSLDQVKRKRLRAIHAESRKLGEAMKPLVKRRRAVAGSTPEPNPLADHLEENCGALCSFLDEALDPDQAGGVAVEPSNFRKLINPLPAMVKRVKNLLDELSVEVAHVGGRGVANELRKDTALDDLQIARVKARLEKLSKHIKKAQRVNKAQRVGQQVKRGRKGT